MMRSTALTIVLVHIMYISFARGFLITTHTTTPSSLHPHILQASTRQNELLTSRRSNSQSLPTTTTPSSSRRRSLPPPPSPTNTNQYTQFFKENVLVGIQRTSSNSRRISGEMIMNIPIDVIWGIISDYDNLAVHVPNLVESTVINKKQQRRRGSGTTAPPRVYQRGAQRIFGFEFGADVTMDMTEHVYLPTGSEEDESSSSKQYVIDFKCVDSQFFSEFDGSWIVEEYNGDGDASPSVDGSPITMVRYVVDVRPKGPVPVAALEWRIKEDVPVNILAVSKAASSALARQQAVEQRQRRETSTENSIPRVAASNQQERKQSRASLFPRRQSRRQPRSQRSTSPRPLQRLTDQATNNIKRTAKAVLPSPMYSTAKQAVNILNNNLPRPRRNDVVATSTTPVQTSSSSSGNGFKSTPTRSSGGDNRKDTEVDWYDDETMAMYL